MFILSYFLNDTISMNDNIHNKTKIIDCLILLNLWMNKFNIYFPYNFYKELLLYLIPKIDIKLSLLKNDFFNMYYDYCSCDYFVAKYNIKHYLLYKINKIYLSKNNNYINNNIYTKITIFNNYYNDIKILDIKIYFINKYAIFNNLINLFEFKLPIDMDYIFKNIKEYNSFNKFNNLSKLIWENSKGLLMDDYIFSNGLKKIIYYNLFKKIVLRLLINNNVLS